MKRIHQLLLAHLLVLSGTLAVQAQSPLTLTLSDNDGNGNKFDGVIFYSGNQYGDAAVYAKFGGSGTKSFDIVSPGENMTKTITQDGFFNIRPAGDYVVDKTKILKFGGNVIGSVVVTAKPLAINTYAVRESPPTPGTRITTTYQTGTGNFPVELANGKFGVQLLDANGGYLRDLTNPNDMNGQYTSRESFGYSKGDIRSITADLPASLAPGTYRVRVITMGLQKNVLGSASAQFTIAAPQVYQVTTKPTAINVVSACPNGQIILTADVVDDGLLGIRETPDGGGKYWVSYYNAKTNQLALDFKTYNEVYTGTVTTRPSGQYTANNKITGSITIPPDLPPGDYYCKIFVGDQNNRLNPNNAGNSPTFTVNAPATVTISDGSPDIKPGGVATIKLSFGGTGPWSFSYDDLKNGIQQIRNETLNSAYAYVNPSSDYLFDASKLLTFSGACGNGSKTGSTQIRVAKQTISTVSVSRGDICPGRDAFTVQFRLSGNPTTVYIAQLSDVNGNFATPKNIGSNKTSPITTDPQTMGSSSPGTYKIRVIASDNSADWDGSSVSIAFTRSPLPVVTDLNYCANAPQPLKAVGQSIFWYGISKDNQPYTGYNKAETPPSPTEPGSYLYQVGQTIDGCNSDIAFLKVTVKPTSSPPGDATRDFCQNEPSQTLTTNAQNPIWYDAGGTTQLPAAPAPPTGSATTIVYKLSQDSNGCRSGQSTVTVRVKPLPAAPSFTPPDALCQFGPSKALSASGDGLTWYDASGVKLNGAPTPTLGSTTTQTYQVSQTKDGCEGPKSRIDQPFKAAPVKPVVTPLLLCRNDPQTPVSATALPGHTLNWYGQNETGGSASAASPLVTTGSALQTTYYVSQTLESTSCESLRQAVTVVVADAPPAPSVNAVQQTCLNTTPTALTAGGTGLVWTASAGGGLTSPTVNPVPPTTTAATFSYTVVQRLGSCVSPFSTITLTVRPLPAAPVAKPLQIACINDPSFTLSATALTGYKLTWYDSPQRTNPQPSVTIQTSTAAAKNWFVTQTDNIGCESPTTPQTSRVLAKATARLYGDGEVYFFDSTAIRIQLGGEGPWNLTLWNDKVITNNLTNPLVVWVPPTTVTQSYQLKALSNECGTGAPSNSYEVRIINRPVVTAVDPVLPDASLTAYPNPASADVRVNWRAATRSTVVLRALSVTGSVVWQVERTATGAEQTELVPAGLWPTGVYTLQLQTGTAKALESRLLKL